MLTVDKYDALSYVQLLLSSFSVAKWWSVNTNEYTVKNPSKKLKLLPDLAFFVKRNGIEPLLTLSVL